MKYKKFSIALCLGLFLFFGVGTINVSAANEINKDDLLEEYGNIKNDVNGMFDSMKDKYTNLANNFGNIKRPNEDEIYQNYLNDIKNGKKELEIDKKLEAIKNTDLSVDNSEMKKAYDDAKKEASDKLTDAKLGSSAILNKFEVIQKEQTKKEKQLEQERIQAAETKYNNIVSGYYETMNKKPGSSSGTVGNNKFSASDLKALSQSLGINFNRAIYSSKKTMRENLFADLVNEKVDFLKTLSKPIESIKEFIGIL